MTSDQTIIVFKERVENAAKLGWMPYGEVLYWGNAVTQAMISDPIDMETARPIIDRIQQHGSTTPQKLVWRFGGRGHMDEKHWY